MTSIKIFAFSILVFVLVSMVLHVFFTNTSRSITPQPPQNEVVDTTSSRMNRSLDNQSPAPKKRLNVLFLMADDLRAQLECYEGPEYLFKQPEMKTPNFVRLASQSLLLKNAFVQYSLCGPSRASMLTSRRPDTTRVYDNYVYWRTTGGDFTTLPQHFKQSGYKTVGIGKLFHASENASNNSDPASWSEPHILNAKGDRSYMTNLTDGRWLAVPDSLAKHEPLRDTLAIMYAKRYLAAFARKRREDPEATPFFLAVGFSKPHAAQICPQRFFDLYAVDAETRYLRRQEIPKGFTDNKLKEFRRAYYACISYVDAMLGELLDELDGSGLADSTVVSFVSDHGYHYGEHGKLGKGLTLDMTARVPMLLRVPGRTDGGVVSDSLVEAVDLFPTLVEAAGLDPIPKCTRTPVKLCSEGVSFLRLIDNPAVEIKDSVFTQSRTFLMKIYSVRTSRYRLTETIRLQDDSPVYEVVNGSLTLFDHATDYEEYENVAYDTKYVSVVTNLQDKLHGYIRQSYLD